MKSREQMSETEIDRNLADSFPASDPPSWTMGTDHQSKVSKQRASFSKRIFASGGAVEVIFHKLATLLNGLHWFIGITTLPAKATPREERSFVLMWLGIIAFTVGFFVFFFIYFL